MSAFLALLYNFANNFWFFDSCLNGLHNTLCVAFIGTTHTALDENPHLVTFI